MHIVGAISLCRWESYVFAQGSDVAKDIPELTRSASCFAHHVIA